MPLMFVSAFGVHTTGVNGINEVANQEDSEPYTLEDEQETETEIESESEELDYSYETEHEPNEYNYEDEYIEIFPMPDWRMGVLFGVTIVSAIVAAISVFRFVKAVI